MCWHIKVNFMCSCGYSSGLWQCNIITYLFCLTYILLFILLNRVTEERAQKAEDRAMGYEMELKYALEQIRTLERQINSGASTEDNTTNAPKATPEKPETSKGPDTTPEKTKDTLKPEREKPKVSRSNSRQSTKAKKK